ncbi:MAG: hypothetical protein RLZ98_3153 [Pseudomonadota bacterium]
MRSGREPGQNLASAEALVREAAGAGASYVQTPETTNIMELDRKALLERTELQEGSSVVARFSALAAELGIWLHIGSIVVRLPQSDKTANRSLLFSPDGRLAAWYDKIHMFDVDLPGGESYRESRYYEPGTRGVVARLPWGGLGMTICYDLRFPYLYRALAKAGARFIAVPAAFTVPTGLAHWHTLLRARAIEAQCFVFAAAQGGAHENGRSTFGHSLVISPWGDVIAERNDDEPGILCADIDLAILDEARTRVPSLTHDRTFEVDVADHARDRKPA